MNVRHVIISIDNSAAAGTQHIQLNIPWPSIMTIKQVDARNDNSIIGCYLLKANWVAESGIIAAFHDGTGTSPGTKFYIPSALQGDYIMNVLGSDLSLSSIQIEVCLMLEFERADSSEEKKK